MVGEKFAQEFILTHFPSLKSLKHVRRVLIDVEVGKQVIMTVEMEPEIDEIGDPTIIRKQYQIVEVADKQGE